MEPSDTTFCHPYDPYHIQLEFMSHLYQCIENKKVAIFESPTGTGKSLSLICSSLTWLRDHKRRAFDTQNESAVGDVDWLTKAEQQQELQSLIEQRQKLERTLAETRDADRPARNLHPEIARPRKKTRSHLKGANLADGDREEDFMLEEYFSDDDKLPQISGTSTSLSSDTQALMDQLIGPITEEEEEDLSQDETKVIFCSRTHSQLTQFVNELRRVKPPASIPLDQTLKNSATDFRETVKHLSLGSRKNLCINPKVSRLTSSIAINERCLELQKPKTSKEHKCEYLPSKDDQKTIEIFRNRALARIQDIEDLGKLGRVMKICPYYASRAAIAPSEVLTLPYPLLLQKSAREALGVSVKDNIVIIDEAHNLMDAIAATFSVSLTSQQLDLATSQVTAYVQKFKNKLKGKNRVYITQVIRLMNSIKDCLLRLSGETKQTEITVTPDQLMSGKGVDQIRPYRLIQYLQDSKLAHKVDGYAEYQEDSVGQAGRFHQKGVLMHLQSFLFVLMNPQAEGRFLIIRDGEKTAVRYALLDPREHFREIVQDARAVILAGGTMSPMSDYADYLFSYLPPKRLETFSFGHVIPATNLYANAITQGPSGYEFDFTFANRKSERIILELGRLLVNLCTLVPDGVVVFFPSYDYLSLVLNMWKAKPAGDNILTLLNQRKSVFEESKGVEVEELLRSYAEAIDTGKGGLMLSVVGGKLSEGINFSDKLGRAVVAVGLPFPNMNGAEWKSKIEHVEESKLARLQGLGILSDTESRAQAKAAGRDFYENACMRAVNQCIGRAIRHKNDYAAILLVDRRYVSPRIEGKLPLWIRGSMSKEGNDDSWRKTEESLKGFFAAKL